MMQPGRKDCGYEQQVAEARACSGGAPAASGSSSAVAAAEVCKPHHTFPYRMAHAAVHAKHTGWKKPGGQQCSTASKRPTHTLPSQLHSRAASTSASAGYPKCTAPHCKKRRRSALLMPPAGREVSPGRDDVAVDCEFHH